MSKSTIRRNFEFTDLARGEPHKYPLEIRRTQGWWAWWDRACVRAFPLISSLVEHL